MNPRAVSHLTSRCSTRPMAAGRPFHCGFASIARAPLSSALGLFRGIIKMPITFSTFSSAVAATWKLGKAVHDWVTNAPLRKDFESFLTCLEHRRVLYAEWQYESMPAVLASLSDILGEIRAFRSKHPNNVELGVLLGELIVSLQECLDKLHQHSQSTPAAEMKAYKVLLKVRSDMARTLAILCGKTGVSPHGNDLEKFIMDMALVRPKA